MAAPNGLSIFPLALITNPQPPEYFVDNLNQLAELIASQCVAASGGTITNPTISGATITSSTAVDLINQDTVRNTVATTANNTTTLANIAGLSVSLTAGGVYAIQAELPVTCTTGAAGISLGLGGTLTFSTVQLTSKFFTTAAIATTSTTATTLGTALGSATTVTLAELAGVVTVNAGGSLQLQMAQQAATANTTSVNAGGFLAVTRIS